MAYPPAPFAPVTGLRGMVNAADHLAASAGLRLLTEGGSAADAAVATAATMAVVGPHFCGMGGDMLAMVCAPGEEPVALLGVGRAGSGVDPDRLRASGHQVMPLRNDLHSTPVPGAVDGWLALHARYGRRPLTAVFAPAIEYAEEGFVASLVLALASTLVHALPGAQELCPHGPMRLEEHVRLPSLGRTLRAIAAGGRDAFYGGEFGRNLLELGDGLYTQADLAHDLAEWCTPVHLSAWGHELWTVPPPSQGYLTLAGAAIAEQLSLGTNADDPSWAHLAVEAARAAGYDRPAVLFDGADGQSLVGTDRLARAASRFDPDKAAPPDVTLGAAAGPGASVQRLGDGDTTHLCAIDGDGLGVSLTQSNALDFGVHRIAGSTGIFLHNRGVGFSLEPGHPAELGPRRRPPHTLSPMLATTPDGRLTHLVGAMGGDAQPQILLQVLARMLHSGEDPGTAVAAARFSLDAPAAGPFRLWWGDDLRVCVEGHAPQGWMEGLAARGHAVHPISDYDPVAVGCAQIITAVHPDAAGPAHFVGAADPRSPCAGTVSR